MMWILYGVLVVILGIVGYYVGKNYVAVGTTLGTGLGVAAGVIVSGAIWYSQPGEEMMAF